MNNNNQYQQVIFGKLDKDEKDYRIIAKTVEINKTEKYLNDIHSKYYFRKNEPPAFTPENIENSLKSNKAVGFFIDADIDVGKVVLIQYSLAVNPQKSIIVDSKERFFFLQRYIFIPVKDLAPLKFQMVKLLWWLGQQNIPILTQENFQLEPLSIPIDKIAQQTTLYNQFETDLDKCLKEGSHFEPSLKALLNDQTLIFTYNESNPSLESSRYIEILLKLIPAIRRLNYPVAIGMFDENYCHWARLLYKIQLEPPKTPGNFVWVNRAQGKLINALREEIKPENKYVADVISPSLNNPEDLADLVYHLNQINYDGLRNKKITDPEVTFCLIPYLSEGQKTRIIENLKDEDLENLLTSYADFSEDLQNLLNYSAISLVSRKSTFINHIVKILKESKTTATREILNELKHKPDAAKVIIKEKGLQQIPLAIQDELLETIFAVYLAVVESDVQKGQTEKAKEQAKSFAEQNIFQNTPYNFLLKDAAISDQDTPDTVKNYFNDELALTLPKITPTAFESSKVAKKLENENLSNLIKEILQFNIAAGLKILNLGRTTQMTQSQTDQLYLKFLNRLSENYQINFQQLQQEMFKKVLFELQDWLFDYLSNTYKWFENRLSTSDGLNAAIAKFRNQPNVWSNWLELFSNLYPSSIPMPAFDKGYEISLTKQTITAEAILPHIVEKWLEGPVELFTKSFTWGVLLLELENHNFDSNLQNRQDTPYFLKLINSLDYDKQYKYFTGIILENIERLLNNQQSSQNQNLITLINTQKVTQHFTNNDWVTLAKIDWNRYNVDRQPRPENYPSLPLDLIFQIAAVAKDSVKQYAQANSVTYLLQEASSWGLNTTQQEEILQEANPGACNSQLIFKYLGDDGTNLPRILEKENLFKLLLQTAWDANEEQKLKSFYNDFFRTYLNSAENLAKILEWKNLFTQNVETAYDQAFDDFSNNLLQNQPLPQLQEYVIKLEDYGLKKEKKIMLTKMLAPPGPDKRWKDIVRNFFLVIMILGILLVVIILGIILLKSF